MSATMMGKRIRLFLVISMAAIYLCGQSYAESCSKKYDIIVYGSNGAAIMAAIAASKAGERVLLLSPDDHIGGVTSSGLGWTDIGNPDAIGGLAKVFYHLIYLQYQKPSLWKSMDQKQYEKTLYGIYKVKDSLMWTFEPHVAEAVFNQMLQENKVPVITGIKINRNRPLIMHGGKIISIPMTGGKWYTAEVFIDASYEGDLMAMAKVSFTIGREANAQYGETINGIEKNLAIKNNLPRGIDPYKIQGNPKSGLLADIQANIQGVDGQADHKLQAYCYRPCLTDDPDNRIMVTRPTSYKRSDFALVIRATKLGEKRLWKLSSLPNRKIDANNDCGTSMDAIGWNKGYIKASDRQREKIASRHRYWTLGLIWTVQNDPEVPADIRKKFGVWGLPKDEFIDNGHFPYALYVREARRMVSDYVMTEKDVLTADAKNAIAMGAYVMDSHNTQRYLTEKGDVQNEGDVQIPVKHPYPIPYRTIVPKENECTNLLVPVCLSASHIAYGSIRMEPVFMILGQSAGIAASIACEQNLPVQKVPYPDLKAALDQAGQVLKLPLKVNRQ